MILYHGSNVEIEKIDLNMCRPYKDFGRGFYLTTIEAQARKMALRTARIYGGKPVFSVFEYEQSANARIRRFERPGEEWARFVMNNRDRYFTDFQSELCNHDCKYDIVIGPVANDDMAMLFRQFSAGNISIERMVAEMEYKEVTNQHSFHTELATRSLKKAGVIL
ncbi:MAG: DUF3990 domain-containing protein [Lachnospiraceae bacterium]|nr:DUF3990 domain-containing protein [Lachnospiraceae bacterium]